ncbi:MAG: membrane protein insertase YidC [Bacteroidaceae bacterium]|nr:membrane protein insertase YidC [Bacteroidaceae bacterium]
MDRNTLFGFLLIGIVLIWFSWFNRPTPEQLDAAKRYNDSIAAVEAARQDIAESDAEQTQNSIENLDAIRSDSARQAALVNKFGAFAPVVEGTESFTTLENDLIKLTLSNKGGQISQAVLKKYKSFDQETLTLFEGKDNSYGFLFKTGSRYINTADLFFTPVAVNDQQVTMRLKLGDNQYFDLVYSLDADSYMVKMDIRQKGMDQILASSTSDLDMFWKQTVRRQEKGRMFEERNSALYYKYLVDDVENLSESKDEKKEISNALKWIGYKNQFFSSAFIADNKFEWASMESSVMHESPDYLKKMSITAVIPYTPENENPAGFRIFLGPNSYPLLKSYNNSDEKLQLDRLIPLGASIFRWINTGVVIPLFSFFGKFIDNYGIIILLLTIVIKIIIAPLTYKSYLSSARMRVLKPQIDEINARYPGQDKALDRQRATMDLYSRAGINPMSGCIPMLLQMPILFAMFVFFPSSIELRGESFLWAKDLSTFDAIYSWDTYIPLITPYFGNHISLFCLLMTVTNILYTKINMENNGGGQQMPGMKWMMYLMPLMFLFIFNNYASGLSYYYFVSTLITIIQTYIFRKCINEQKVLAKLQENQKKPRKKSGFMARLEEAQRQQQAMLREQQKRKNKGR